MLCCFCSFLTRVTNVSKKCFFMSLRAGGEQSIPWAGSQVIKYLALSILHGVQEDECLGVI